MSQLVNCHSFLFGHKVPGSLPSADKPGHGVQLFPECWLILLLSGHQEQGGPAQQGQEEGQPINPEEKHEAQRGVLQQKEV